MSDQTRQKRSGRSLTGAVIAGVLMVPITAIAAVALVQAVSTPAAGSDTEFAASTTATSIAPTTTTTESVLDVVAQEPAMDPASIDEACTAGAEALLAKEADASLSDIETAALAALREICEEHDMALPAPVGTEVVRVVTVPAPTPTTTAPSNDHADDQYEDDNYDDDEYEDHESEHHEDDDHEDEHHEDEHHEDDD